MSVSDTRCWCGEMWKPINPQIGLTACVGGHLRPAVEILPETTVTDAHARLKAVRAAAVEGIQSVAERCVMVGGALHGALAVVERGSRFLCRAGTAATEGRVTFPPSVEVDAGWRTLSADADLYRVVMWKGKTRLAVEIDLWDARQGAGFESTVADALAIAAGVSFRATATADGGPVKSGVIFSIGGGVGGTLGSEHVDGIGH